MCIRDSYGIGTEDLIFDGLCMTVSSDSKGALTTLETLRRIRDELGCKSVLGVSNISFGLPQREIINASFFTMAMECGLSAAIVNPNSEAMMRAYYSFNALMDMDPQLSLIHICGGWWPQTWAPPACKRGTEPARLRPWRS